MLRILTLDLCLKGLAAIVLSASAVHANTLEQQLVLFYNVAQAPPSVIAEAQESAAQVFLQAGIELAWLDCSAALGGQPGASRCGEHMNSRSIIMQVVGSAGAFPGKQSLGYAAVGPEGGIKAVVFYDRVRQFTASGDPRCMLQQILGHAMAHEIGHLLLSLVGHTPSGIMAGTWRTKQLQQAADGELFFTLNEAERMRKEVRRRSCPQAWDRRETAE